MRHADAGYQIAIDTATGKGIDLPMLQAAAAGGATPGERTSTEDAGGGAGRGPGGVGPAGGAT